MSSAQPQRPGSAPTLLDVRDLTVRFHGAREPVVAGVSFSVAPGGSVGVVGESGSGKSVTSLAIMGLLAKHATVSGAVRFDGRDLASLPVEHLRRIRGADIAMVFQEARSSLNPSMTVGDQIAEVVRRHRRAGRRQAARRAVEVLDLVGIPAASQRARSFPHELSGGMLQRVMIGVSIACEPRLLIADEPTTALDVTVQAQILELLEDMRRDLGLAMVFVTHDLGVVADVCDDVVVMYAGQIVEGAPAERFFHTPQHPYSEALIEATPQIALRSGQLQHVAGVIPTTVSPAEGCTFGPRCRYVQDACGRGAIELSRLDAEHTSRCVRSDELDLAGVGA